jgi:rhodanese-related sulfurtransferase
MGPLVPDIVSGGMNLVVALLLGIAFGFVLEQAGFSSSRKLTGLFYGRDFTVLRVFFTAGVTAMSGVLVLSQFGLLDTDVIYINPTFLHSAILGGAIMGVGFVLGGFCPGTSVCAAAVGRIDGMVFVLGGLAGIFAFGEAYPRVESFYTAGAMGDLLVFTPLGISAGQFALLIIGIAVAAFVVTSRLEKKINPSSPAKAFPARYHRMAAAGVLALGLVLAATPSRKSRLLEKASDAGYLRQHPVGMMTADELAFHILDRDPHLQLVDVREASDFARMSLPGAANIPAGTLFGKQWRDVLGKAGVRYVFFARDGAGSVRAAALAGLLGYRNVAALRGGLDGFTGAILNASAPAGMLSPQDADTYRFRLLAAPQIAALIRERGAPKPVKAVKRVQGGCGS